MNHSHQPDNIRRLPLQSWLAARASYFTRLARETGDAKMASILQKLASDYGHLASMAGLVSTL